MVNVSALTFDATRTSPASRISKRKYCIATSQGPAVPESRNPKCGNLPAAAGYIRQPRSTQPRQEPAQLSAEKVRRKIHQHVAKLHLAIRLNPRKYFATNRDALLHNPAAAVRLLLRRNRLFN